MRLMTLVRFFAAARAFGFPTTVARRARSTLIVAPADGQTFVAPSEGSADLSIVLSGVKAQVCVRTQLEGRPAPSPETCLENVQTIDLSNVPHGHHRLLVRDAGGGGEEETLRIDVVPRGATEFVPDDEWRPVGEQSVPAGLDIRLPLDGSEKLARVPPSWRLQLFVEPPDAGRGFFFRADVTRDTPIRALEADLERASLAKGVRRAPVLALRDAQTPFHADATAGMVNLFAHQHRLTALWLAPDAQTTPEAPPKAAADQTPAKKPPRPPAEAAAPPPPRDWAAGGPLRVVRPPKGYFDTPR